MTSRSVHEYLLDLHENILAIESFIDNDPSIVGSDLRTRYAVIRAYEIIGHVAKNLPTELLEAYPQVDWKAIKGFRDFLAHNYNRVRIENILDALDDLPVLKSTVEAMLAANPPIVE